MSDKRAHQRCRACGTEHTFDLDELERGPYHDVMRECPTCGEMLRFSVRFPPLEKGSA
jgi:ribosomal protein L32